MKIRVLGAINILVLIVIAIPIAVLRFCVDPVKRGFFCNDENLSHPLRDNTVSSTVLCVVGIGLPIAIIIVSEWFISSNIPRTNKERFTNIFFSSVDQLFGVGVSVLLTDIAKYTIGRLRYVNNTNTKGISMIFHIKSKKVRIFF